MERALGTGAAALILFETATLTSFVAGVGHCRDAKKWGKRPHICQTGLFLAVWIMFGLTLYGCHEAMSIIERHCRDGSVSIASVKREMISRKLVPITL